MGTRKRKRRSRERIDDSFLRGISDVNFPILLNCGWQELSVARVSVGDTYKEGKNMGEGECLIWLEEVIDIWNTLCLQLSECV